MRFLGVAAVVLAFGIAPVAHGQSAPVEIADGLAPVPPPPAAMLVVPSADLAESPLRPLGEAVVGLGGLAGLLLFDGAATLVAWSACGGRGIFDGPADECFDPAFYAIAGVLGAASVALVPLAIWGVGRQHDGAGDLGWTMLGYAIGSAAWAVVPAAAALEVEEGALAALIVSAIAAQITGAVLGFEISSSDNAERAAVTPNED
jgi:hypothetical protein